MMRVTPHPAFVANVSARRGALDYAPALRPLDVKATWTAIREQTINSNRNYWLGRIKADPNVAPAIELLKAAALPEPFDAQAVAVAERVTMHPDASLTLVRVIAEARGIAEMVAIKLDSTAMGIKHNQNTIDLVSDEPSVYDVSWDVARAVVCHADDATYAKARDVASSWRAAHHVTARVAADFLFPSETAWADADMDELIALSKTSSSHVLYRAHPLLASIGDAAHVTALVDATLAGGSSYHLHSLLGKWSCDLVAGLPPDDALGALTMLLDKGGRGAGKTELALLGNALAALEGEAVAQKLAGLLLHSPIGPIAVDYFRRFPELAKAVLPKVAAGTSKAADAARSMLASVTRKDDSVPLAEGDEVPKLLREALWRKKKKSKPVVLGALPPSPTTKIEWADEAEKELAAKHGKGGYYSNRPLIDMTVDAIQQWKALLPQHRSTDVWFGGRGLPGGAYRVPQDMGLIEWNENPKARAFMGPLRMLAIYGDAALPGLFTRDAFALDWTADALFDAQLHAPGAESARVAAAAMLRRKGWRKKAQDWIAAHARVVTHALLPTALGKDSRERKEAEHAIRWAARSDRDGVLEAARFFGPDGERAAHELIDRDPLLDLEVKGKLPPFVRLEDLPFVRTRHGKRLPEVAVAALLEILRSTSVDAPYVGLESLREELDASDLGELAWALVQSWILAGAKRTFEWIPMSLVLIGDDTCARRLAPYVRDWARKDRKKASMAVDVLAAMGSSAALLHLSYVADKSRFEEAKKHAKETLERVAAEQGLTTDELADRTVPDLDLDKDGTATLDFGPRAFTVTFDEGLNPIIKAGDGARLPSFPRGTKTDDSAKVKIAQARFKGLKADAETVAQSLLRRFESAMCRGRTWHAAAFRMYVLEHPLVTHLARRLVWSSNDEPFRVADDGSLADQQDAVYSLGGGALVSLPHPLTLGKDATLAWSRVFSDYAIVQCFEQLARATYTLSEAEMQSPKLTRYEGRTSRPGPLMGSLEARGWHRWADETSLSMCDKKLRTKSGAEAHVTLGFDPGIDLQDIAHAPDQTLRAPSLGGATWSAVDPIDLSELIRDLEFVAH